MEKASQSIKKQRLDQILRGAFAGSPTPLKDIPTKSGDPRAIKRKTATDKRRARKNKDND
jgi:hypothetical protein